MHRSTEYLQRAEEAETRAQAAKDDRVRQSWLVVAEQWRELAQMAAYPRPYGRPAGEGPEDGA
jgi:hypothetical protein